MRKLFILVKRQSLCLKAFVFCAVFFFTTSCSKTVTEDQAVMNANAWLTTKDCSEALSALKEVHSDPSDFGYDGKVAWAAAEACEAGFFLLEYASSLSTTTAAAGDFIEALVQISLSDTSSSTMTELIDSNNADNDSIMEHLRESLRILQLTDTDGGTNWSNEVNTNLLFLSLAIIGRFSYFHGHNKAAGDYLQDWTFDDPAINGELTCLASYTNQQAVINAATMQSSTLGYNGGPGSIDRNDACVLFHAAATFNVAFTNVGSIFTEVSAANLTAICDLSGADVCTGKNAYYSTCLTDTTSVTNSDLYGLMCVLDSSWAN